MSVIYGAITFTYPRTEINVSGPGLDPSGSERLYTVIKLKVRAHLNLALLPSAITDNTVGDTLTRIRHYLCTPRLRLYYDLTSLPGQVGASPIIDLPAGRDDANGPFPDPDAFSAAYTTPNDIEVTWAVTVKILDCSGFDEKNFLSLRWDDSIEFDKYFKATYRRQGTLIVSSLGTVSIDEYRRNKIAPAVAPGFAREQAHYTISRDGLRCDFAFVDGQIRYAPPYPAVDMDIVQSETWPLQGQMRQGRVSVQMRGSINANPVTLQQWAQTIGLARLNAAHPLADTKQRAIGNALLTSNETKDSVEISFSIDYKVPPPPQVALGVVDVYRDLWRTPGELLGTIPPGFGISPPAPPTKEGRDTKRTQPFGWVGKGTSDQTPAGGTGFDVWASPGGAITGPADGVLLAPQIRLFAALLNDPCGQALTNDSFSDLVGENAPQPGAAPVTVTLRTNPNQWDTTGPAGGQGGPAPISTTQLTASVSALNANAYPSVHTGVNSQGVYKWDGQPGVYEQWQSCHEYIENPGVIVVPACDPAGKSIPIRFASTQWVLRKRWVAARTGAPPKIVPRDPPSANWVYTGGTVPVREMRVSPVGVQFVYEASGIYEFMALDPTVAQNEITAAISPFLNETALTSAAGWVGTALFGSTNDLTGSGPPLLPGGGNPLGYGDFPGSVPV